MTIYEAMQRYLNDSLMKRRADKTRLTYRTAMHKWTEWAAQAELLLEAQETDILTCDHVRDFVQWMATQELTASTMRLYITGICGFYRYCIANKLTHIDFADWTAFELFLDEWRKVLKIDRFPRLPNEQTAQQLFATAEHPIVKKSSSVPQQQRYDLIALRNEAIVQAYDSTAARVHELCKLKRADLDMDAHQATVSGKGKKTRILYFNHEAWAALMLYLRQRDEWLNTGTNGEPLFMRHDRKSIGRALPLSTNAMRENLLLLCRMAGVERVTPHQFRHRAATKLLQDTGDMALVQEFLGHASISTTQIYAHVAQNKLRDAVQKRK